MPDATVSTEAKVAALREPAAFPGDVREVQAIETHMSWVFLTERHVYKLKKPVRYDGLDFSTLQAREFFCREELRLNRRLAAAVYLDVVPLCMDAEGQPTLARGPRVVDWLVKMQRLPAQQMLDHLLQQGTATADHMREVAAQLARFHRGLPPAVSELAPYMARLQREIDACERGLCNPLFALPQEQVRHVCEQLRLTLRQRCALFEARVGGGRIVEGHGDLRPEHIYLGVPPAIIDCLEFSAELRTVDTADELSFLALECERLGAPHLGRALFDSYAELTGDRPEHALIDFYQAFRACIRARVAIDHLKEAQYRDSPKWAMRARHYLDLAEVHAARGCGAT